MAFELIPEELRGEYAEPKNVRDAAILTHQLAWLTHRRVEEQGTRLGRVEERVGRIEMVGKIALAVLPLLVPVLAVIVLPHVKLVF